MVTEGLKVLALVSAVPASSSWSPTPDSKTKPVSEKPLKLSLSDELALANGPWFPLAALTPLFGLPVFTFHILMYCGKSA